MDLFRWEIKKIFARRYVLPIFAILVLLNVLIFLVSSPQIVGADSLENMRMRIHTQREKGNSWQGVINLEWISSVRSEAERILHDPQYQLSKEEAEIVKKELMEVGLKEDYIDANLFSHFLTKEGEEKYNYFEELTFSGRFYELAKRTGDGMARTYLERYPGEKGMALAEEIRSRYDYLAEDYLAHYNYSWGYERFRSLLSLMPFNTGLLLVIALAPIFSDEIGRETVALILTSKRRRQLVRAKISSGILFAVIVWTVMTFLYTGLSFGFFGMQGWEAYWQNWTTDTAPFPWNQGEITLISIATSFFGTIFFSMIVMLLSALTKTTFFSMIVAAATLLFPFYLFAGGISVILGKLSWFLPTYMMMGISVWSTFELVMICGNPVIIQYPALVFAMLVCVCCIPLIRKLFIHFQVKE